MVIRRARIYLKLFVPVVMLLWLAFPAVLAHAQELTYRSVQVSSAQASVVTTHKFTFTVISSGNVSSIVFEYCDNSPLFTESCTAPPGLDVSSADLTAQSGNVDFGIDPVHTTDSMLVITRIPILPTVYGTPSSYTFTNITNPSTPNQTVFIRISTYATADASGSYTDNGAVAFATVSPFSVSVYVPPYLRFCVGITVSLDCSFISGDSINLGTLTTFQPAFAQSQFSTGTNDDDGYVIYALGTTMTSGNNAITALATPTSSFPGNDQFGINLRANSSPAVGQDPSGSGTGIPEPSYDNVNQFMFNDGDAIAYSTLPSDYNVMTVAYLVNINSSQPIGVYSTTLTYVATVQF